jgi:hypothetical protein
MIGPFAAMALDEMLAGGRARTGFVVAERDVA